MQFANKLFNYMIEQNKPLTTDDMFDRFQNSHNLNDVWEAINVLEEEELIERPDNDTYIVSKLGWEKYNEVKEKQRKENERERKQDQLLELNIQSLVDIVHDYPKTESRAKWAIRLTILGLILSTGIALLPMLCNKPH
ncbi:MAG: phage replisome organizer N-terminal domain-containing protein [Chitinophagaceae bacterium]|nr:phage replisome organizer N-terminal domain-containing protein [Chitinophagaceae bacterium]